MGNNIVEKLLKLNKKNISYLQFILEGYEGLAMPTTIDKNQALVKLFIMSDFVQDIEAILEDLKSELDLEEVSL
jgi:hypothetical protein